MGEIAHVGIGILRTIGLTKLLALRECFEMRGVPLSREGLNVSEAFEDADVAGGEGDAGGGDVGAGDVADCRLGQSALSGQVMR